MQEFPATDMRPAGSGTGGTGGLVIKVIIIFFFRNSQSCQSGESCALGRIAEPRGRALRLCLPPAWWLEAYQNLLAVLLSSGAAPGASAGPDARLHDPSQTRLP